MRTRHWDFISDHCSLWDVEQLCGVLNVSRSGYSRHLAGSGARAEREAAERVMVDEIRSIHGEHGGAYGAPRVHAELRGRGHTVNRKRVTRLICDAAGTGRAGAARGDRPGGSGLRGRSVRGPRHREDPFS